MKFSVKTKIYPALAAAGVNSPWTGVLDTFKIVGSSFGGFTVRHALHIRR